jgi:hypothetical protein
MSLRGTAAKGALVCGYGNTAEKFEVQHVGMGDTKKSVDPIGDQLASC